MIDVYASTSHQGNDLKRRSLRQHNSVFHSTSVVEPTTWQVLPAMLLVERSGFGLNELLDLAPITGTAACLEQQAAASIAEEKSPRPKYGRSSRCDQDRSRSLARTPRDHCVCKRKNARTT